MTFFLLDKYSKTENIWNEAKLIMFNLTAFTFTAY